MMMMMMMMTMMMVLVTVVEAESSCMWLRKQEGHTGFKSSKFQEYNNYTISMLRKMGNSDNSSTGELLHFPEKQYSHASKLTADEKLVFLVDTLDEVSRVFDSESLNDTNWDQGDVDMFNSELFRQITELQHCVKVMGLAPSHSVNKRHRTKIHFKARLERILKEKDYSASGWEDVRVTLLTHLLRLDLFAATI